MAAATRSVGTPRPRHGRRATSQLNGDGAVDPRALRELVGALDAARRGDFSERLSKRRKGVLGEVAASYNDLVATNQRMT